MLCTLALTAAGCERTIFEPACLRIDHTTELVSAGVVPEAYLIISPCIPLQVKVVVRTAKNLLRHGVKPSSVGIITPYAAQAQEIAAELRRQGLHSVTDRDRNDQELSEVRWLVRLFAQACYVWVLVCVR